MRRLERTLGVPREKLLEVASHSGAFYRPFSQGRKARPFQRVITEKLRLIDNPIEPLKSIQERIDDRLLNPLNVPDYQLGGVKGKSTLTNVAMHLNNGRLTKLDIRKFFPTISNRHIFELWRNFLGCGSDVASLLTKLTTVDGHLPQGAATSTRLANLVLHSIDLEVRLACEDNDILYTTWIDDLALSGEDPAEIIPIIIRVLGRNGFKIARDKLEVIGRGSRRTLNGVLMGRLPGLTRERRSQLRAGLYRLATHNFTEFELCEYIRRLRDSLGYANNINPTQTAAIQRSLRRRFGSSKPLERM